MANTIATYEGDGIINSWTVPAAYLKKEHIHLYVDGVEKTITWLTSSSVAAPTVPADGAVVTVKRITPRNALITALGNSGSFRGSDINNQALQALYVAEEGYDFLEGVLSFDNTDNTWDAESYPIKNIPTPENNNDAANKAYVDAVAGSASAAATSASSAATSATAAANSATAAANSATSAGSSATSAASSASSASSDKATVAADKATVAADKATVAADKATVAADKATTSGYKSDAQSYANDANTSKLAAASSASAASSSATSAASSATAAASSATAANTSATNAATSASNASSSASSASTSATNAASSASSASSSASTATTKASDAASSASAASTSASNASTSATNAASSASAAATSETNAAASATSAAASYDSFDDRYLGSKTSDPTVDNDGNALLTGALYWNSASNVLKVYNGSAWVSYNPATASGVTNTPAGNIASTDVQSALNELDSEKLAASSYTASDVLTKIKTVDGASSGLDADLLDGYDSLFYQIAAVKDHNFIVNGTGSVSQENGRVQGTTDGYYGADQWFLTRSLSSGTVGFQSIEDTGYSVAGYSHFLAAFATTGITMGTTTWAMFEQRIEGAKIQPQLRFGTAYAKGVNVGFWVYATKTGTFGVCLRNAALDRSYTQMVTITNANTWQWVSLTYPGCTTGTWGISNASWGELVFVLASGSSYVGTANQWNSSNILCNNTQTNMMSGTNDGFYVTGVVMVPGDIPLPPSQYMYLTTKHQDVNILECLRYFVKVTTSGQYGTFAPGQALSATTGLAHITPPVYMRAKPIIGYGTLSDLDVWNAGGGTPLALSALSIHTGAGATGVRLDFTCTSGLVAGNACMLNQNAAGNTGYINLNARL